MSAQINIVHRPNSIRVERWVDGLDWRCWECGWLGEGLLSAESALKESGRHWDEKHSDLPRPVVQMQAAGGSILNDGRA